MLYVHPALLVTGAVPAQNLVCRTLETKEKAFPTPKNLLLLLLLKKPLKIIRKSLYLCAEVLMKLYHARQVSLGVQLVPARGSSPEDMGMG